ncbi:hypothetical protein AB0L74_34455 [Streptomyces sp. NPDC052020]|uniref:hypothetical protein n=1 Tax=Streptomyces sp. NPDC052020 TaxID=3155677 RepID=UPI0034169E8D
MTEPTNFSGQHAVQVPPVLRSRQELIEKGVTFPEADVVPIALPITSSGATYQMAQSLAWLDDHHFLVGRWDGSISVFAYTETQPFDGPLITKAANSPAFQGVRMVVPVARRSFITSNDDRTIALWNSREGDWSDLRLSGTFAYAPSLGVATAGRVGIDGKTVVIGHTSGHLSIWNLLSGPPRLTFVRSVDLRNPNPVNPWGLHDIHAVEVLDASDGTQRVISGSEDGYLCIVEVPSGEILSQMVYNPTAQRGINDVNVRGESILVANCSVGAADRNLWYYTIDRSTWAVVLRDSANLIADTSRPQVFNFNTIWGAYSGGPCWFASTEEGALWMGTAETGIDVIGYQAVTSPLGSALGWRAPGRLVMVAYDLYEFNT